MFDKILTMQLKTPPPTSKTKQTKTKRNIFFFLFFLLYHLKYTYKLKKLYYKIISLGAIMARKIVVTSGKGGVGKTTICANLGAKLAGLGFRVALLDADIGLNNLDVVMGIENKIVYDIADVINGKCRIKQALIQDERFPTLYVMPSAQLEIKSSLSGEQVKLVVDMLSPNFDYILIDCPAGVDNGFHRAVFSANEALVVVTPHISSIRDADKVLSILSNYNLHSKSLIINRVRGDMLLSGEIISIEKIIELLNIPIMGVIPDDDAISTLSSLGAFAYGTTGAKAFSILAENVHNGSKKIYDCTYRYRGFMGVIRRNIKRKV